MQAADALGDAKAVQDICFLLRPWLRRALGLRADRRPSTQHTRQNSGISSAVRRKSLARSQLPAASCSPVTDVISDMSSPSGTFPSESITSGSMMSASSTFAAALSPVPTGAAASPRGGYYLASPTPSDSISTPPGPAAGVPNVTLTRRTGFLAATPSPEGLFPKPAHDARMSGDSVAGSEVSGSSMSETFNSLFSWSGETATSDAAYEVWHPVQHAWPLKLRRLQGMARMRMRPAGGVRPTVAVCETGRGSIDQQAATPGLNFYKRCLGA